MAPVKNEPVGNILLLGGNGRLGRALRPLLPPGSKVVVRGQQGEGADGVIGIEAYDRMPALFEGITSVINCVGVIKGTGDLLTQVNVTLAGNLARTARSAGVRRFVHVSSFSIYGMARHIDRATDAAPASEYGRSKLEGDEAILSAERPGFEVATLRLPAIIGAGAGGKVERLISLWSRIGVLPIPSRPVRRSMIGFDLSARLLLELARGRDRGVVFGADPEPFEYRRAAVELRAHAGGGFRTLTVPDVVLGAARLGAPGLYGNLFGDSLLEPADNLAVRTGLSSTLYRDIVRIALALRA